MFREFKEFVNQGNAMDLAVGVIIGAAFSKIVNSIVADLVMPVISLLLGGADFRHLYIPLNGQGYGLPIEEARKLGAVITYGMLLQNILEFFLIAFTIFLVVRQINKWRGVRPAPKV